MQPNGFLGSLFDYSFSSFITSRIIKVLYVLTTIVVALWTLLLVLAAFNVSSGLGLVTLVIIGPLFFLFAMIYARVGLELLMVIFRIHEDVRELNQRGRGDGVAPVAATPSPASPPEQGPAVAPA
jgi:hypothetical protein